MATPADDSLRSYIEHLSADSPALARARADAEEYSIPTPDSATGTLLSSLAAGAHDASAIAVSPAAAVVGLYLLAGLPNKSTLTCIDPEPEHQRRAREIFRSAGYAANRTRFLPAKPLDVLGRMAPGTYRVVYLDLDPLDAIAGIHASWPLLAPGGTLVIPDLLLDGTVTDETRRDRSTAAAREAIQRVAELVEDGALASYQPLGAGTVLLTRRAE